MNNYIKTSIVFGLVLLTSCSSLPPQTRSPKYFTYCDGELRGQNPFSGKKHKQPTCFVFTEDGKSFGIFEPINE